MDLQLLYSRVWCSCILDSQVLWLAKSGNKSGYYWILDDDGPGDVYCGMNYTGLSCEDIYINNPETGDKNGYYPINNIQWTFCNMMYIATVIGDGHIILSCPSVGGEWRRIASINISAGDNCPTGWNKSSYNGVSFCRAPSDSHGCYPTLFSTNGVSYKHVCGRARGYQKGAPDGFDQNGQPIDSYYVDGLSITHGNPRQHIWTYAAGLTDNGNYPSWNCPVHVLLFQDQLLPFLFAIATIVNLEQEVIMIVMHITYQTHCGMVQVVPLTIHVVPTLTNHGSITS